MSRSIFVLGVVSALCWSWGLAAADCAAGSVALIVQDSPLEGERHMSEELFANAADSITAGVSPGTHGRKTLFGALVSQLEGTGGIEGWSIGILPGGDIVITSGTTEGTAAAPAPDGIFKDGFERTVLNPFRNCPAVLVSAVVPSFTERVTLPVVGTATVLRFEIEAVKAQGTEPVHGELSWPDDLCRVCPGVACGQPSGPAVTVDGATRLFCERRGAAVTFREAVFRRGDVNSDARVDLSDAVRTFMYLFLGAAEPACLDAADTNDSGQVDLTDGILILNDFFRQGTAISEPGPFACGADPTKDELDCRLYSPCE